MTPEQELFTLALGLANPWKVVKIDFDETVNRLDIALDYDRGSKFKCPICGKICNAKDSKNKTWRHLNFFQHESYLTARVPRVSCEVHGVHQISVPWARAMSGFTLLFESFALVLVRKMPMLSAAKILGINDTRLWRIFTHYITKSRKEQDFSDVTDLGLDETSSKKRHKYISLFVDLKKKSLIFGTSGKDAKTVEYFCKDFKEHGGNPEKIEVVCCDLSPSFTKGVKENLKNAELTYDRFHIKKLVNEAMDEVRRAEVSKKDEYKKTRYALLKNPKNLTKKEKTKLATITNDNSEIARAYKLKVSFDDLFLCQTKEEGKFFLEKWIKWAQRSRLSPFLKLKKTLEKHQNEILNWFDSKISNGLLEGINSLVQNARNRARGYKNDANLINMSYLIAGKWANI